MKRTATITWKGSGKEGKGTISTQSHAVENASYAWNARFEDKPGTNPEELLAAAHAACFSMKLSFVLGDLGFVSEMIETTAEVHLENSVISSSHLTVTASVPEISDEKFQECANNAKDNCPVSKALNMTITLDARLKEGQRA